MNLNALLWILRGVAAAIFLQTLFFKFSGAPESVWIFEQLGAEPWGRIGSGIAEGTASILILIPSTTRFGAPMGLGVIAGALGSHLTRLGIEIQGDGGLLFGLACTVFVCCAALTWVYWLGPRSHRALA